MGSQFVHNHIDSLHISGVDLLAGVSLGEMFHGFVHGGLVVANGGGNGIDGLLAGGGVGIRGGDGDESRDSVQNEELQRRAMG